jgi:hypothetical protein
VPGEYSYVVRVLRKLESRLIESEHHLEGGRVGLIVQRLSKADNIRSVLADLYTVEGYDRFALRLMYYGETVKDALGAMPDERLVDHHVRELFAALLSHPAPAATPEVQESPAETNADLGRLLEEFEASLQALKRCSFKDEAFTGVDRESLEGFLQKTNDLGVIARKEKVVDVARFSAACSTFVHYALDQGLLKDVRVINILDNASLTLQTVLQTAGEENVDALQQMVQLLEDPSTLLE